MGWARQTTDIRQLFVAIKRGDERAVAALLDAGTDIECRDRYEFTPLMQAAMSQHPAIVSLLIGRGADVAATTQALGLTPLHLAIGNPSLQVVELLLDAGAPLERQARRYGTPLQAAWLEGRLEEVELLLARGSSLDISACGNDLWSTVARRGCWDLAELLIRLGLNLNTLPEAGLTLLMSAAYWKSLEEAQFLLDHGADPHIVDNRGLTAWHYAQQEVDEWDQDADYAAARQRTIELFRSYAPPIERE